MRGCALTGMARLSQPAMLRIKTAGRRMYIAYAFPFQSARSRTPDRPRPPVARLGAAERIHRAHASVKPVMLKILGQKFRQSVVFGVSPHMRVEPAQLVCRTPAKSL